MAAFIADERLQLVPSKYSNFMLAYRPSEDDDAFYIFRKSKTMISADGTKSESYRCRGCERATGEGFVSTTLLRNGRLVREPDPEHKGGCDPLTRVDLEALKLRREMSRRCREGDDPRTAFEMVLAESAAVFDADDESKHLLREKIGSFESISHVLKRNASKNRDEEYSQLSTRERRRRSAIDAARKRKAAQEIHPIPSCAIEEAVVQESLDESSTAVVWLHSGMPVVTTPIHRRSVSANTPPPRLMPYPKIGIEQPAIPEHDYETVYRPRPSHSMAQSTRSDSTAIFGAANSTRSPINGRISAKVSNTAQSQGAIVPQKATRVIHQASANVTTSELRDIVKVVEACRKKTRWESFGDYVAKTLESMPADTASKAAREIQEVMFRFQGEEGPGNE